MTVKFYNSNEIENNIWNDDIINPTQLKEFGNTRSKFHKPVFLIIDTNEIEFKWQFFLVGYKYFNYIDIVSEPNIQDINLIQIAYREIIKKYKPFKINFYSITLSRFKNKSFFEGNKFDEIYEYASNQVNLSLTEEELFSLLHSKHRNVIRKAEKDGVIVYENSSLDGIEKFQKISIETYSRSGKDGLALGYLQNHFNALSQSSNIRIFFSSKDNKIQAAAIFLLSKYLSIYWHGASINNSYGGAANYLHWEVMKIFKNEGIKYYDFGGISLSDDEKAQSINRFKIRFGGEMIHCYGGVKIFNQFKNKIIGVIKK